MDPEQPYSISAPGARADVTYAPARDASLPAVDERLVAPGSRAEILDGQVYRTRGATEPHGTRHFEATMVIAACLADGYLGAVDMLTRADENSDSAPDISVFPAGRDPETGGRRLEEVAFEVLDTELLSHVTRKVEKFAARGVRRLFCVRVKARTVYEWSREHGDWQQVEGDIVDRCFRVPIPVSALIDRVAADDAVARARVLAETNVARLDAWIVRAATAASPDAVFG